MAFQYTARRLRTPLRQHLPPATPAPDRGCRRTRFVQRPGLGDEHKARRIKDELWRPWLLCHDCLYELEPRFQPSPDPALWRRGKSETCFVASFILTLGPASSK